MSFSMSYVPGTIIRQNKIFMKARDFVFFH